MSNENTSHTPLFTKKSVPHYDAFYNKTVLYTGVTNNLQRRLYEHRMGINDSFTKRYHVYYLVYYETISNIKDAIHREKSIKGFSRNKKEVLINSVNPEWKDLSKEWL